MIIWLLTSEFPPLYGGGISTYCIETANMFSQNNHEITIITQDYKTKTLSFEHKNGYRIIRFNPNKYYTTSFLGFEANLSFAFAQVVGELIKKEGCPDIVESQEYNGIAYYLLQYKWLNYPLFKDIRLVLTLHAPSFLYLEYNKVPLHQLPYFWIGEMEKFCIRAADLLISPSQYLVDQIKSKIKIDDRVIHVIKNPYLKISEPENSPENNLVFFGKLTPQKGCLEVIDYFKNLWDEGFDQPLYMIGGGNHYYHPEGRDMIDVVKKKYYNEIKKNKLKILGSIPPKDIDKHLNEARLVIVPSTVDNLPYTVLEAMSLGKVVLASMQGGQSELIESGKDGFLFDHKLKSSFQNQLKHILSLNSKTIKEIKQNAVTKVQEDCSYSKTYDQKIALFNKIIGHKEVKREFPYIRPILKNQTLVITPSKNDTLLTVVIPYYNMGKYVDETLSSIRNSSYKDIEIILVDDGSNEKQSVDILQLLAPKYNVIICKKKNEGLSSARNDGAQIAKGNFIAFLDPDDTVEPEYFEKALKVLKEYDNIYFVGCWAKYFGDSQGYWPSFNPEPPYLLFHNMINSSALVYKKQAFLASGLNDPNLIFGMEDYESVINLVSNGFQGVVLPEPLWNYRIRKNSIARAFTKNKQLYLYRLISEKHNTFFSTFAPEVFNILNANGSGIYYDNPTLIYDLPGNNFLSNGVKRFIIKKIKENDRTRKLAIKLKRIIKK